jgi:YspA, cpYpsA-related SLOG family
VLDSFAVNFRPKRIVLVTGGRDYSDADKIFEVLDSYHPDFLIEGGAMGVDALSKSWAEDRGIHYASVPALWNKHGRVAGPMRNGVMVAMSKTFASIGIEVLVIAFPGGTGTANCVSQAKLAGLDVIEVKD